jgi:hypothetical protein
VRHTNLTLSCDGLRPRPNDKYKFITRVDKIHCNTVFTMHLWINSLGYNVACACDKNELNVSDANHLARKLYEGWFKSCISFILSLLAHSFIPPPLNCRCLLSRCNRLTACRFRVAINAVRNVQGRHYRRHAAATAAAGPRRVLTTVKDRLFNRRLGWTCRVTTKPTTERTSTRPRPTDRPDDVSDVRARRNHSLAIRRFAENCPWDSGIN